MQIEQAKSAGRTSLTTYLISLLLNAAVVICAAAQVDEVTNATSPVPIVAPVTELVADRVFDGEQLHEGWVVRVQANRVVYAGVRSDVDDSPPDRTLEFPGQTLLPGLIEGHSHLLLHPYNETSWNDQVLKESEAERVARGVNHARASLMAGITTLRDLGSEGAGYADVGLRDAINKGVIPGPRVLVAGPALVATGSYGPKGFRAGVSVPLGAQAADGHDDLSRAVREQIGHNIDLVKIYADYRWGPNGLAMPTFTERELALVVELASSSGRKVAAHAATAEGIRRAVAAGAYTIEHGYGATPEVLALMAERGVALCPTLAAGEAISTYAGWRKGIDPVPERVKQAVASFRRALAAGVPMCFGGDVGVYAHGDNVVELELMVEYGMAPEDALRSATSGNADLFGLGDSLGRLASGQIADIIAVGGNPVSSITALRDVTFVMQSGRVVRHDKTTPP